MFNKGEMLIEAVVASGGDSAGDGTRNCGHGGSHGSTEGDSGRNSL